MITNRATALAALKTNLQSAASRFQDPDLNGFLDTALTVLAVDWPRWQLHELELEPGLPQYPAPAEAQRVGVLFWGTDERIPAWSPEYAGVKPSVRLSDTVGGKRIELSPPPTARQVMRWGARATVRVGVAHELTEDSTTLHGLQPHALLLRAQVEAMRALASGGVVQPIQRHQGMGASPAGNSTPAALVKAYMSEYREVVNGHPL